ncbi:MAG: chlorite dismutase family protein [Candidatus Dormibacteraeota bacterium]|nr:chlorite dismutase family protein [Candidatus Dormibacteraeota bacterium]
MPDIPYVQALALGIDPAWRRRPTETRHAEVATFGTSLDRVADVTTRCYSALGRRAGTDLFLWRLAPTLDALEEAAAVCLDTGLGRWCSVAESFVGVLAPSPYGRRADPGAPPPLFGPAPASHLIVYPFTKTSDWWLLAEAERRRVMGEHIAVGRSHGGVRQLLANSFGIGDHDFLVAYETDDVAGFSTLVRELRSTEGRRWVARDTPILVGRLRTVPELERLLLSAERGEPSWAASPRSDLQRVPAARGIPG